MYVDNAECEIRHEFGVAEHVDLLVVVVAEFEVNLIDRVVVEFGVNPRVIAVTDVQPDAHVLVDPADDPVESFADDGVIVRRRRKGGLVDLDVLRAGLDEAFDLDVDEIGEFVDEFLLGVVGLVERPVAQRVRPGDRHLDRLAGDVVRELELVDEPRFVVGDLRRDGGLVEVVVPPDLDRAVELVAVDPLGEELDHFISPDLAVDDGIQPTAFVFVGDDAGGVVVGLLQVLLVKFGIRVVDEVVSPVQPLRLGVGADDGRQQEVIVGVVVGVELRAVVGRAAHAVTSSASTLPAAAAIASSLARCLFTGR